MALNLLYIIKRYIPKTKKMDLPIDGNLKYKGEPLIGESTTLAGLILSLLFSIIFFIYFNNPIWTLIPVLVYLGHLSGSFIKRRMHKKGGEFVPFVDHGDYIVLTGIVFFMLHFISLKFFIFSILLTYLLHPVVCFLAFRLKIREYPY